MNDDVAISVQHVSKTFKLPHEKQSSIKGALISIFRGGKRSYEKQQVLKDVSFEIKKGEFFGIVGRNGSGKSTMLKLLARIYSPTEGTVQVNGKLTPFIELGVGFNPELTGRENVFLNGALLGFNRKEMLGMYDDIVDFAEIEKFMDLKLKNYSSGMQVRLAFSIAIRARSDILLLDEVLAVGDADFQRKCLQYFNLLKQDKKTVVFVSHDMESVRKFCDRVILIDNGELTMSGTAQEVVPEFMSKFVERVTKGGIAERVDELPLGMSAALTIDDSVVNIGRVWLEKENGKPLKSLDAKTKHFDVCFEVIPKKDIADLVPGLIITNDLGEFIIAANGKWAGNAPATTYSRRKKYTVRFRFPNVFELGNYHISVNVVSSDLATFYSWKNRALPLLVTRDYATGAKTNPEYEMQVKEVWYDA